MRTREHGSQLLLQKFTQGIKKNKVLDIPLSKSTVTKDKLLWPYAQSRSYMLSKDINFCIRKWKIETTLTGQVIQHLELWIWMTKFLVWNKSSKIVSQMWICINECVVQLYVITNKWFSDSISLKNLLIEIV